MKQISHPPPRPEKTHMGHIAHLRSRFQYVTKTVTVELSDMKGSLIVHRCVTFSCENITICSCIFRLRVFIISTGEILAKTNSRDIEMNHLPSIKLLEYEYLQLN